jgi:hypothetical protein
MTDGLYNVHLAKGQGMIPETILLLNLWQPGVSPRNRGSCFCASVRSRRSSEVTRCSLPLWSRFPRDEISSIRWRGAVRYGSLLRIVCERIRPQSTAKRGFFLLLDGEHSAV